MSKYLGAEVFKQEVNRWLEETGLTQKELAKLLGIPNKILAKYLSGEMVPHINTISSKKRIIEEFKHSKQNERERIEDEIWELEERIEYLRSKLES